MPFEVDHRHPTTRAMASSVHTAGPGLWLAAGLLALSASSANAVLGAGTASVEVDRGRMNGQRKVALAVASTQIHEISTADGSTIREFVSPGGTVFAVAWRSRFKPNLALLLGPHHQIFVAAADAERGRGGIQRGLAVRPDNLVVQSFAHLNTFVGKAYVPSLVPGGFNVDDIR
jgi:hypothetical protein